MPRYFFNLVYNGRAWPDEDGTELPDIEEVRVQALTILGNIAKNELTKNGHDNFQVSVRDEWGHVVLTASVLVERPT
jgi:hypothetical protein